MDLRRQIALIRQRFPLLLAAIVLGAVTAFGLTSLQHSVYEAKATLIVGQSLAGTATSYDQLLVSQRLSTTYASLASTRPVLQDVVNRLKLDLTPDQVLGRVQATAALDSSLLTIIVQDEDPQRAAAIANALAARLVEESPTLQGRTTQFQKTIDANLTRTQNQMSEVEDEIAILSTMTTRTPQQEVRFQALQSQLSGLRTFYASLLPYASGQSPSSLTIVDPAEVPASPVAPSRMLNVMIGALLGLLIAGAFVSIADYLDDSFKNADDVAAVGGMNTLGLIPRIDRPRGHSAIYGLTTLLRPRSRAAETYRTLRTNIGFAAIDKPIRTILVTSSVPKEGKTEVAANLAVTFAEAGRRVLLVDADLRRPSAHLLFDLPNVEGLTTLLLDDGMRIDSVARATENENLRVVTAGPVPPNPVDLLSSSRMQTILGRLKDNADVVVFDSPPQGLVADAAILASFVDATVLVIAAGRTRRRIVGQSRESLERAGATVVGAVLNGCRIEIPGTDYYGDYYREPHAEKADERLAGATESTAGRGR